MPNSAAVPVAQDGASSDSSSEEDEEGDEDSNSEISDQEPSGCSVNEQDVHSPKFYPLCSETTKP